MPPYVKLRSGRCWFQIAVPKRLQPAFAKTVIQESLKTSDIKLAAEAALDRAAYWKRRFRMTETEPRNLHEVYVTTLEETRERIEWINRSFPIERDREHQLDYLEDRILEPEMKRLGLGDTSELNDAPVSDEVVAAFTAVRAAKSGDATIPPEYREPFSETSRRYLEWRQNNDRQRVTGQTKGQMETTYRLLSDHIKDAPLVMVTRPMAAAYFDKIGQLSRHWGRSKKAKQMSLGALLSAQSTTAKPHLTNRTQFRYAVALIQIWNWAADRGELTGHNPFTRHVERPDPNKPSGANAPWTEDAILALLASDNAKGPQGNPNPFYWLPRIALLSGMRLDEICSLEVANIKVAEGVRYFDITKGKTYASRRVVPFHPALQPLLELLPKSGPVFPSLKPGGPDKKLSWNIGKRLGRRFRKIPGGSTFHGFRKSVAETFERERVPETEAAQILGHKKAGMTYGVYSPNGLRIDQKRDLIELLALPKDEACKTPLDL